jgi:hypothetical protein
MRSSSTGGLLLLLVGAIGLIGFLTGNLDRWLAFLFDPGRPGLAPATVGKVTGPVVPVSPMPTSAPLATVGQTSFRATA